MPQPREEWPDRPFPGPDSASEALPIMEVENRFTSGQIEMLFKKHIADKTDWRKMLKEKTGEELSARAMVAYFQPLMDYLKQQNKGRKYTI